MAGYILKLYFSKMRTKFTSIYRHLAFCDEVVPRQSSGGPANCPVVCGGGWLALDHPRPLAEPAIRSANNLRR